MNSIRFMDFSTANQIIEFLGWIFVHSLWQFALIAALAGFLLRVSWQASSETRSKILTGMLVLIFASPVVTGMALWSQQVDVKVGRTTESQSSVAMEPKVRHSSGGPFLQGHSEPQRDRVDSSAEPSELMTSELSSARQSELPEGTESTVNGEKTIRPWLAPLVGFWCIGIVVCSIRPMIGWRTLHRLKVKGVSTVSSEIRKLAEDLSRRLELKRSVEVFESTMAQVPAVVGYIRPVILLPTSLVTNIPVAQLEGILAHELGHIRRHDFLVNLSQILMETLFFYHPAVWWLSHRVRVEREHCCDDLVVRLLDNRIDYVHALIEMEELRNRSSSLTLAGTDGSLVERIKRISGQPSHRSRISAIAGMFLLICLSCVIPILALLQSAPVVANDYGYLNDEPLPEKAINRFGASQYRLGIPISNMVVSNCETIAAAVNERETRVFDFASGESLFSLGSGIEAATISPDTRTIVTKQDFSLRIRNASDGVELRRIVLPRSNRYSVNQWVKFTPDGEAIAVTSQGMVIHLIDFESGEVIREFSNENPESSLSDGFNVVLGIAFSLDGRFMASGGFANDHGMYFARLWDVESGEEIGRFMHTERSYGIPSLAFSPDATRLATRSHDGVARIFDVTSRELIHELPADGGGRRLGCVAFSPNGETLAVAGDSVRLFDVEQGEERLRIDSRQACDVRFTDGGMSLVGAVLGSVCRWDSNTGNELTPAGSFSVVDQVLVSPDDRLVISRGGYYGDVHIWDGLDANHLKQLFPGARQDLALSSDGRFLVWPVRDDRIEIPDPIRTNMTHSGARLRLYDLEDDSFVDRFPGYEGSSDDHVLTSQDVPLMTVGHRDGVVRIWDMELAEEVRRFDVVPDDEKGQLRQVSRATLSPDGQTLAVAYFALEPVTVDENGRRIERLGRLATTPRPVRFWNVESGQLIHELGNVNNKMTFSPDSQFFVCTSGVVRNVESGTPIVNLRGDQSIQAVAFSHDGRFLATAVSGKTIQIWATDNWTKQHEYEGHDQLRTLTFSHGGRLFSGSGDTTVIAWEMP